MQNDTYVEVKHICKWGFTIISSFCTLIGRCNTPTFIGEPFSVFLYDIVYGCSGKTDLKISILILLPSTWENGVEESEMSLKRQMLRQI